VDDLQSNSKFDMENVFREMTSMLKWQWTFNEG